jgi:tetratricopeptide (TPR) repeat protein
MTPTDCIGPDLDEFIERFESALGRGADPDLADFLPPKADSRYPAVLCELVRVDLEFAWDHGNARQLEAYRDRFPELFADPVSVRAVAWEEYRLRRAAGQMPSAAEYHSRFGIDLMDARDQVPGAEGTVQLPAEGPSDPYRSTLAPVEARLAAPGVVGESRYDLRDELARGGMGTVYRAIDRSLGREVAVKVLRDGPTGVPGAARRFVEEARITGQLQHPGIPAVHDLGALSDGRPFLAMRLIHGRTLAEQFKQRADPAHDRSRFVAVFEQVCQAVGYAHNRGVVHRDLKPSNVMVGPFGEVQVMDWGLAKDKRNTAPEPDQASAIGSTPCNNWAVDETQAGSVLGTPAYMAPEQARGETARLDERTDVFGLGAILCELLTGQPPFVGVGSAAVAAMAAAADVRDALIRLDGCGADAGLVDLCKSCLAASPTDRPRDAAEVAAAVTALRIAADERAWQAEVDRARAEAAATGERQRRRTQLALVVSLFVLGAGGAVAVWAYQHLADERRREADSRRHEEEREYAAVARASHEAIDQAYRDMADGRWTDARNSLARAADRLGAHPDVPGCMQVLRGARNDLAMGFALEEARLARAARRPGLSRFDTERTLVAYEAAFERYGLPARRLETADAAGRVRASRIAQSLVVALDEWSALLTDPADRSKLLAIARSADDDPWRGRLRDLRATRDTAGLSGLALDPATLSQPAATIHLLAMLLPEAERVALLRAAQPLHPTDFWISHNLGLALLHQGRARAADAVGPLTAAVALRPQSPGARVNLASALIRKGDPVAAIAACRAALRLDPTEPRIHQNLGVALRRHGDAAGAVASYREAIRLDPSDARTYTNLGGALEATGDRTGALAAYREALRLNPADALAHTNLGGICRSMGDRAGALAFWREAARLNPTDAASRLNVGAILRELGDLTGSEAACREAVRLDPGSVRAHSTLGTVLRDQGNLAGAVAAHREAIRLKPTDYIGHFNLGNALRDLGDLTGAAVAYREAIRIDPSPARGHLGLGHALLDAGDLEGAVAAYREATQLSPSDPRPVLHLVEALTGKGDLAGAVDELRSAPDTPAVRAARARAERRLTMSKALPELAAGKTTPASPAEALAAAEVSLLPMHRQYGLAYRLYLEVLTAEPDLVTSPTGYEAAGAAIQLAAGQDPARPISAEDSARLHEQARTWLRQAVQADPDPQAVTRRVKALAFAPVREPAGLAALPVAERRAWERLWSEVAGRVVPSARTADGMRTPPADCGEDTRG